MTGIPNSLVKRSTRHEYVCSSQLISNGCNIQRELQHLKESLRGTNLWKRTYDIVKFSINISQISEKRGKSSKNVTFF